MKENGNLFSVKQNKALYREKEINIARKMFLQKLLYDADTAITRGTWEFINYATTNIAWPLQDLLHTHTHIYTQTERERGGREGRERGGERILIFMAEFI